jgi:aspartyl-tRNA(Asn)/glutamyl-tRNA(Gln) amidotransferase subunit A
MYPAGQGQAATGCTNTSRRRIEGASVQTDRSQLHTYGIRDLNEGYAARAFTPTDVIESLIAHIGRREPDLCALYAYAPDVAREQAAAATSRWASGRALGPLDGVPATVKDNINLKGVPTPLGTAAGGHHPAETDAPPASRLKEAGAVIFAKTTMPDYGMLSSGLSSFHKLTRNPWDLSQNPGGSSSGAGAAAAACYGPIHIGTDIGGSIRLPAGWCGVVGFKPSLGRVPIDPYYLARCAGPLARSVDDAAFIMAVLSRPDPRDATSLPAADLDWHAPPATVKNLRVGLMRHAGCGFPVDAEVAEAVDAAADMFRRAGATIVDLPGLLTREMLDGIDIFWRARAFDDIAKLSQDQRERILPYILAWAAKGETASGRDVIAGFNRSFEIRRACAELFQQVDAVLSPVSPTLSFPAKFASPLNDPDKPFDHITFTLPWNFSEQPAIALPYGFSKSGLPIGVQLVLPRFADVETLALARWIEAERGPLKAWPTQA